MSLVTPIVGPGNVSAQVNLDMDFTRNETTEEIVDPKGTATRSKQTTLDISTDLLLEEYQVQFQIHLLLKQN